MSAGASSRPEAGSQLPLELVPTLPVIPIEPEWKDQPRLWGHSFHPMCSYLASFPAALAHAFVARYSRPGDVVLDPFSGRGTVPFQACVEGRVGVGNDLNPLAHLLTAAKVDAPSKPEARLRTARLQLAWQADAAAWTALAERVIRAPKARESSVPPAGSGRGPSGNSPADMGESVPPEVALAFHPTTLGQLLSVRAQLRRDDRVDRFLAAAMTGILHGKSRGYLSTLMPNTFSMAPRYVRLFAARTGFSPVERDLFGSLTAKLDRLYRDPTPSTRGIALAGDARDAGSRAQASLRARGLPDRVRLVVTSPPYLRVVKYGYYNWLRTWFLGEDAAAIDRSLDDAHQRASYLAFVRDVLSGLRPVLTDDAVVVLVIGDVEMDRGHRVAGGVGLADAAWELAAEPEGYRLAGVAMDPVASRRKMTRIWGDEAGRATKTDRILVLASSEAGRRRALHAAGVPIDWAWPPRHPRAL